MLCRRLRLPIGIAFPKEAHSLPRSQNENQRLAHKQILSYIKNTDLEIYMCTVVGCEIPPRSGSSPYCEKHYIRLYRNGTLEKKNVPVAFEHSHGYVLVPAAGHFLARGSSHAYEHRVVYHKAHGDGPFPCYWCQSSVAWDDLHIDHLDDNKKNNSTDNLVASCAVCNQKRGQHKIQNTWRTKVGITALGMTKTMNEWALYAGISRQSIIFRLKSGLSFEDAITKPKGKTGPRKKS
jgi:hypothetical protein